MVILSNYVDFKKCSKKALHSRFRLFILFPFIGHPHFLYIYKLLFIIRSLLNYFCFLLSVTPILPQGDKIRVHHRLFGRNPVLLIVHQHIRQEIYRQIICKVLVLRILKAFQVFLFIVVHVTEDQPVNGHFILLYVCKEIICSEYLCNGSYHICKTVFIKEISFHENLLNKS